jgi:glycerol-3-phosphate acyltransferase PlsX
VKDAHSFLARRSRVALFDLSEDLKLSFEVREHYFNLFNFENYGGTPILGIKGNVVIGHGSSNETAVLNMILHANEVATKKLSQKIKKAFN